MTRVLLRRVRPEPALCVSLVVPACLFAAAGLVHTGVVDPPEASPEGERLVLDFLRWTGQPAWLAAVFLGASAVGGFFAMWPARAVGLLVSSLSLGGAGLLDARILADHGAPSLAFATAILLAALHALGGLMAVAAWRRLVREVGVERRMAS